MAGPENYNSAVETFREHEFPMLKDGVYLDHAGTTLYSRSLVDRFSHDMMTQLLGNPHAASSSSMRASALVEDVRLRALQFFGADPTEFDLVFVANATAGAKLVAEAFRAAPRGFHYAYHQACHTSLVGMREEAKSSDCLTTAAVEEWIATGRCPSSSSSLPPSGADTLFAYPAQSNMNGQRFPLSWAEKLRNRPGSNDNGSRTWTLLDAAAYVSTSPLDLSDAAETGPDFVVLSFYKIFGFPDLGALLVRRGAETVFDARRYFGGGTVDVVVCSPKEQWHVPKGSSLHERLEDGTLPIHSIAALGAAMETHRDLFGSMQQVAQHTTYLARRLYDGLAGLRHASSSNNNNGPSVCQMYSPQPGSTAEGEGPVVAFNVRNAHGAWASLLEFDKLAHLRRFHVRTGGVCNPGGIATALGLEPWEVRRNFSAGLRCGSDLDKEDVVSGKPTGVIRASLGAMSTIQDVDEFVAFVDEFYRDGSVSVSEITENEPVPSLVSVPHPPPSPSPSPSPATPNLVVSAISVYPIKSCGAFAVSEGVRWEVRPEGLAWDREWCLLHRGTGRALSQKQFPQMALVRPVLDFEEGMLRVSFAGKPEKEVQVPLSDNPVVFASPVASSSSSSLRARSSRVCGEEIAAQVYTAEDINEFFSSALGVPCVLARFPPGGQGKSMRHAKAHLQKHQGGGTVAGTVTETAPSTLPSPPDSDSEKPKTSSDNNDAASKRRILLSNESPILAIHMASLRALNAAIQERHSENKSVPPNIPPAVFRANIVLDTLVSSPLSSAYAEETWSRLRIGNQSFKMLGACRRCHMVCIDQQTGAKSDEPFVTLAKTRRFDGKVFFGTHMGHDPEPVDKLQPLTQEQQFPTIMVGDPVEAE